MSVILDELVCEKALFDSESHEGSLAGCTLLAAVSGGADSVALLCLLHRLAPRYGYLLCAVTVDHRIRNARESAGDAFFVDELCASLCPPVPCRTVTLAEGEIAAVATDRKRGIEEAARFVRYRHFEEVADSFGASFIMTGHNRNDQLETILMRFFQGSGGSSLGGIAVRRGRFVRPLLAVSRSEITAWLASEGRTWREDITNAGDEYLRNKIRNRLVPVLDGLLPGWQSGVITAASRALLDDELCSALVSTVWTRSGGRLVCPAADYAAMHPALRLRFLRSGLVLLGISRRVPYGFLRRLADFPAKWRVDCTEPQTVCGSLLRCSKEGDSLFLSPDIVHNNKSGYLVYILSRGTYHFPFGTISVSGEDDSVYLDECFGPFRLPLTIRSRTGGDSLETADGNRKLLKKLLNDWSIPEAERDMLPLIEQEGTLRAVYGRPLGYPDWYVHI